MPAFPAQTWVLAEGHGLAIDRPLIVGILNVTPDSFADGGKHDDPARALDAANLMASQGADMLDLGGESTRPGAARVDAAEQLRRVLPVLEAIRRDRGPASALPISIDTTSETVARAALNAGAHAINDVSAGTESQDGTLRAAADHRAGLVLMHRLVPPTADQFSDRYAEPPRYADVVQEVRAALSNRLTAALTAGLTADQIVLDPGLGFGKSVDDNLRLIARTRDLLSLGRPVMSALSRKSFVGRVSLGRDSHPDERLEGTLALSVLHAHAGASLFRVHDVAAHRAVLDAWRALAGLASDDGGQAFA